MQTDPHAGHLDHVASITSNELSVMRTIMASDRTLMAWVRTSLSLQSFGFTIYKLLQGLLVEGGSISPALPLRVGLALSFASVFAMVLGIAEYWFTMKSLGTKHVLRLGRFTILMAALIGFTGIILFVAIATHLL